MKRLIKRFKDTGSTCNLQQVVQLKTSKQFVRVLQRVQEHQISSAVKNWLFRKALSTVLSRKICIFMLTKFNSPKNCNLLTSNSEESSLNRLWNYNKWMLIFSNKIILSDEAHFHLDDLFNRKNCRIWSSESLRVLVEKQMHPQRVNVWCGFCAGGVIESFFFENAAGQAIMVKGADYPDMLI